MGYVFSPSPPALPVNPVACRACREGGISRVILHTEWRDGFQEQEVAIEGKSESEWVSEDCEIEYTLATAADQLSPLFKSLKLQEQHSDWTLEMIPSRPLWQSGPTCGFAALQIAAFPFLPDTTPPPTSHQRILSLDPAPIDAARARGHTSQGELYSAHFLAAAAAARTHTCVVQGWTARDCQTAVSHGAVVVFPYDKDGSNAPAMNHGHTAHWAVCVGYISRVADPSHVLLLCYHGRSQRIAVWDGENVVRSNRQLQTGFDGDKRVPGAGFVIPDTLDHMMGCAVVLGGRDVGNIVQCMDAEKISES